MSGYSSTRAPYSGSDTGTGTTSASASAMAAASATPAPWPATTSASSSFASASSSASAAPLNPMFEVHRDKHISRIRIGRWSVRAEKRPILSIAEVDAAEKQLGLPLPEMTFGNNCLRLEYGPEASVAASASVSGSTAPGHRTEGANPAATTSISFTALDALGAVGVGEGWEERLGGGVRVSMADKWGKRSASPSLLMDAPLPSKPVKPHDWTYSSTHAGRVDGPNSFVPTTTHEIPIALLSRQDPALDPILFYEDVPLFEDELHDNGESILNARIRVMPHSWFILARLFVRVDNVLFRLYDVRIYHALGSDEVVREISGMEADYEHVKAMLEKPTDLSPLTDANWVSWAMSTIIARRGRGARGEEGLAVGSDKGREGGKGWPGLGKRVEVMYLSKPEGEVVEGVKADMEGLRV